MTTAPTSIASPAHPRRLDVGAPPAPLGQLLWLLAAALVGYLVPYLFADLLEVPRDAYYAIHAAAVFAFFVLWARATGLSARSSLARNWKWAILLGAAAGAILAGIAFTFD